MYSIKIEADFSAAHNLRGYKGKCEELHGHNWKVEVVVSKERLDKIGMVVDFKQLKNKVHKVLEQFDHKYLNNLSYFKEVNPVRNTKALNRENKISNGVNPTSENIARFIYDSLKREIPNLNSVTVWESDNCSATFGE